MRRAYLKRPLDATFTPMPRLRRFIFFTRARFSAPFRMRGWKVLVDLLPDSEHGMMRALSFLASLPPFTVKVYWKIIVSLSLGFVFPPKQKLPRLCTM